ncbi:hypothetical protein C7475_10525 [Chitinophaga sp. S165]|nr:hypothetical protein C7475_10525 [Chitinophaga sp. S165]
MVHNNKMRIILLALISSNTYVLAGYSYYQIACLLIKIVICTP